MKHSVKFLSTICLTVLTIMQTVAGQQAGEIHKAVAAGDLNKVKTLIEADANLIESKDMNGRTPLNLACLNGFTREPAIAKFLIDKGANVNSKSNDGLTPLHGACSIAGFSGGADFDLVQLLIGRGANINAQDNYGRTPLYCAVGSTKIARVLIEHGADVNAGGNAVLPYALIYDKDDELSKLLIESGAKSNRKDSQGNTELHLAAMRGFADVILLLVKNGTDVNTLNNSNRSALYFAAKHGYKSAANVLIAAGANKSTIVESNYGKAKQLSITLDQGEAYLWYLKLGGYAIKTKNHLLILSPYININSSLEAGLVNGQLNPNELTDQSIIILTPYPREDFLNSNEGKLSKLLPKTDWIFYSSRPTEINKDIQGLPDYHLISPNENISFGEIKVCATPRTPGIGFLYEVDGVKIFDGNSYMSTNEASRLEAYRKGIDSLKNFEPIDIAILHVRTDGGNVYEPYLYLIDQLSPKTIYLVEGINDPEEYSRCANFLRSSNIEVKHPETNAIAGDRFHYLRDSVSARKFNSNPENFQDFIKNK
jgi:ankyrin repeat protein